MLFNSYIFILAFLPLAVIGYFLLNKVSYQLAKAFLLCMSLWYYAYFNLNYLPIIVGSIVVNFTFNKLITRADKPGRKRMLLALALILNIGTLFYFKYYDFFIANINSAFGVDFTLHHLILPLGISFFTFQQLSYIIDSYRGEVPDYNALDYALFVTFFPQLIAGPIVTHNEIVPQFADVSKKRFNFDSFAPGLYAFGIGLAKKVLIADTFGNLVNWGYGNMSALDSTNGIIVMLVYTMQIYFDFSGYCDMATGIGRMFNIDITMNFNSPYKALTITDFWKRWHITLTRFFAKYVYIPLGGNRKGRARTYLNMFIVFLVSGLWHGANWTFVLWGALHGAFSVFTKHFKNGFARLGKVLSWLITFAFINFTWIYFRAPSVAEGTQLIKNIFTRGFGPVNGDMTYAFMLPEINWVLNFLHFTVSQRSNAMILALGFVLCLLLLIFCRNTNERIKTFRPTVLNGASTVFLMLWCIVSLSGVSTFLYFNF